VRTDEDTPVGSAGSPGTELAREQSAVGVLYARLDQVRAEVGRELDRVRRAATTGTPAAMAERDAFETLHAERVDQLRHVEERLAFGRLDLLDGSSHHVGRIGLSDGRRQVLLDWRAPVAGAFYQATAAAPGEVARRRHLTTQGRGVTSLEDEVFDGTALPADAVVVSGQGALFGALEASRTGRMRDIVATVQAEQDRVVRAPLPGVLVVQGGPGTGKTAVALHRAAYLLYTHRDRIVRTGVLLVGPSPAFLDYVSAVLPSLGETGVVTATPASLYPGVTPTGTESRRSAALKGDARMAGVVAAAVRDRQRVPSSPQQLAVDSVTITLWPRDVRGAIDRARRTGEPHMVARRTFALDLLDRLATRCATVTGTELDADGRRETVALIREVPAVVRAVNRCWLPMTPERLLQDLFSEPDRLAACTPGFSSAERALLSRDRDRPWTDADVPLLDEAAELLGEDDTAARAAAALAAAERGAELAYAAGVTALAGTSGMVDAELLADRYAGGGPVGAVSDRAATDRTWTYGHVIVDEAQELSPMAWRVLVRRCPSRSMTVVGDVAQTGSVDGAGSWAEVFDVVAPGRWRVAELTVNYRTPGLVMELAARVLAATGAPVTAPTSAREGTFGPLAHPAAADDRDAVVASVVTGELTRMAGDGTLAVLTPAAGRDQVAGALLAAGVRVAAGADGPVSVLAVGAAKGLEFDVVVVVEPTEVVEASERGINDLYVALTRPTQRLHVVHARPLPTPMAGMAETRATTLF